MDNKYLTKLAAKLSDGTKDDIRQHVSRFKANADTTGDLGLPKPTGPFKQIARKAYKASKQFTDKTKESLRGMAVENRILSRLSQEKIASLLKGKKLIMKTSPNAVPAVKGKSKDIGMIGRMIDRVDQVERIKSRSGSTYKTRLNFPDGYKGFIRASDKGVRSRLYKDD